MRNAVRIFWGREHDVHLFVIAHYADRYYSKRNRCWSQQQWISIGFDVNMDAKTFSWRPQLRKVRRRKTSSPEAWMFIKKRISMWVQVPLGVLAWMDRITVVCFGTDHNMDQSPYMVRWSELANSRETKFLKKFGNSCDNSLRPRAFSASIAWNKSQRPGSPRKASACAEGVAQKIQMAQADRWV